MAITTQEKLSSSMYQLSGYGVTLPYLPGTMEAGEMAHVQGLYAGITFSTGVVVVAADVASLKPLWRGGVRRR